MSWLAIDTATDRVSVAIGRTGDTAHEEHLDGARRHAAAVLPIVARLLELGDLTLGDLRGIVVADGPGSFTGLRVGASIAKALADTRGRRIVGATAVGGMTVTMLAMFSSQGWPLWVWSGVSTVLKRSKVPSGRVSKPSVVAKFSPKHDPMKAA